jgi:hypothetical protein
LGRGASAEAAAAEGSQDREPDGPGGGGKSGQAGRKRQEQTEAASAIEVVQWIFDHIGETVRKADAPSPGAYEWLREIERSPGAKAKFYEVVYPKMLPSRAQIEATKRFADDGRAEIKIIGDILRLRNAVREKHA